MEDSRRGVYYSSCNELPFCFLQIFQEIAYKATSVEDITHGLEEFMANSTVLPPSEWDPSIRIEPPVNLPDQVLRRQPSDTQLPAMLHLKGDVEEVKAHVDPDLQRTGR